MNKAKRRAVIAGNWKMNKNRAEAKALITELLPLVKEAGCEVVICTPYTNLETALALTEGSNVKVGAENCHWAESGAFTGEISAQMLKELGVQYVIIGHSERRQYFGETDETVAKRVRAALESGGRSAPHHLRGRDAGAAGSGYHRGDHCHSGEEGAGRCDCRGAAAYYHCI